MVELLCLRYSILFPGDIKQMINLIIVDDEEITRNSLVELVPWNELGIDAVKSAPNGIDALELAMGFTPSVILSDVRMPKMDGIELAKKIRQLYPDCVIVFLSGFSDKEYLKSAIQLNAVDYLEKPIDIELLKSLFRNIVQKLLENKKRASEEELLKVRISKNIHLMRQEITLELVLGKMNIYDLVDKYGTDVFRVYTEGVFTVANVMFNWIPQIKVEEKSSFKNSILKMLNGNDLSEKMRFLSGFIDDAHLILIFNDEIDLHNTKFMSFLEDSVKLLLEQSMGKFSISVAYSYQVNSPSLLPELYKSTLETLKQQFYIGINKILRPLKIPPSCYEIDKEVFNKFKKLLRNNSTKETINFVRSLTKDITNSHDPDINKVKNVYFNLIRILLEVKVHWEPMESGDDNENKYIWQEVESHITLQVLSEFLVSNIETICKKLEFKEEVVNKLDEIHKYILEHYTDNQLSIQNISSHTFLSQTYLCAFFKKSTGKTINEFITELRIERAKELLKDSRIKLYEVASFIGYTDANYFSTIFKKYLGFAPSEYRERYLYDKKNI